MKDLTNHLTQMMHRWPRPILASCTIVLCLIAPCSSGQTSSAAISGHVIDQSNSVVADAEVTLVEESTNIGIATHTNPNGDFIFTNVQPGTYTVVVKASGFKELRKLGLVLSASQNLSAGILSLSVGTATQSITVEADITPLQTTSSERSGVIDTEQMDNLLAVGRDAMALTRTIPGVVGSEGAGSLSQSTIPVTNGVNNEYGSATVDGVMGNVAGNGVLETPLNLDSIKEITVMASNYQAQYGKQAGASFNFVTKSGTQHYHSGVYEYFRNEDLNANSFFNKYGVNIARPRYRYNTVGGTLGGPVYWPGRFNSNRDKLFFFVSVEDSPTTSPDGLKYYTVPTLAQTQGDFSQTYNQGTATQNPSTLIHIKNPNSSGSCARNSSTPGPGCFSGNVIPSSLINTSGQILLKTIYSNTLGAHPSNAFTNLSVSNNNYNYVTNYSADHSNHQEVFRIDYAPWEKLHTFFRAELATINNNGHSSPASPLPWLMPVNYQNSQPNYVLNITYAFTPTLVNELNLGKANWDEHQYYSSADLAKVQMGSTGLNLPALYQGVNPQNLYPQTSFGDVANAAKFSWDYRFPLIDTIRAYTVTDNLTKVIGPHTLKFGVDSGTSTFLQNAHNRTPTLNFTADINNPSDSNFGYANAMLGNLDNFSQNTALVNYRPRATTFEFYEQDTWKAFSNLTIDFGVRHSWAMAQEIPKGNNFVPSLYKAGNGPKLYQYNSTGTGAIDPTTGLAYPRAYAGLYVPNTGDMNNGILFAKTPGYPEGTVYGNGIISAPRVGFSWQVLPETVIRGGFGLFYNILARSGQQGDLGLNAPTTNSVTQYYSSIDSSASNYYMNAGVLYSPYSVYHAIELHPKQLYVEEGSLGIQQELPAGIVLDVAYVGSFTKHASDFTNINEVPYGAQYLPKNQINPSVYGSGTLPVNFFRPYPGVADIYMQYFNLTANYNALQARVTRRFHNGLEFGGAYTFSRSMDYTDAYNGQVATYQNLRSWNYGPAGWDIKHNLVVNCLWSIPKGSHLFGDKLHSNNVVTRAVLDNWQISGIASYQSGAPGSIGVGVSSGQNLTGGGDGSRAVLTCDPWHKLPHTTRTFNQWFNTSCVEPVIAGSVPSATYPSGNAYSVGNGVFAPKVSYFLPGDINFDTALFESVPIEGKFTAQLRVETYNTFNHAEFNGVSSGASFANANSQGASNPQMSSSFGRLSSTQGPRVMQLALRINF